MNIRYILPFIESTQAAFHQLFDLQPEALAPFLVRKEEVVEWDIGGVIRIVGEAKGLVALCLPGALALSLTAQLTGTRKEAIDDEVADTIGELVNIVAGNAKKGLEEFRLQISLPAVVRSQDDRLTWPSGPGSVITVPFSTDGGRFNLSVGLEHSLPT